MRICVYLVLIVLLCSLFSAAFAADLPNLITDSSMENWSGTQVVDGWQSFNYRTVEGPLNSPVFYKSGADASRPNIKRDGLYAQGIDLTSIPGSTDPTAATKAGIYRQLQVTPGKVYIFTCWARMDSSVKTRAFSYEIGIDPSGGSNPSSALWSDPTWNDFDRVRGIPVQVMFFAKAQSSTMTLYLGATALESASRSGTTVVVFDKVGLFEVDDSVRAQLTNPGFESGFDILSGFENPSTYIRQRDAGNPVGWVPFGSAEGYTDAYDAAWNKIGQAGSYMSDGITDSDLDGLPDNYLIRTGSHALRMMNNKGTCNWGVYQRVSATRGQTYTFSGWINGPAGGGVVHSIGIDPSGGTNPDSTGVEWLHTYGTNTWTKLSVVSQASSSAVTLFLRVKGVNKAGGNETKIDDLAFQVGNQLQVPTAPVITAPVNGAVGNISQFVNVTWNGDPHQHYEVRLNTANSPTATAAWSSGDTVGFENTLTAGPLPFQGIFYIFVRLKNSTGWGPWSQGVQYIMNMTAPNPPVITTPVNGSTGTTSNYLNIAWTGDVHDAYEVRISSTSNPENADTWNSGIVLSSGSSCSAGPLSSHGNYYIFVRLRNMVGWGIWSSPCHYQTNVALKIIPEPQITILKPGNFYGVTSSSRIIVPPSPTEEDMFAANQLHKKFYAVCNISVPVVEYSQGMNLQGAIALGQINENLQSDNPAVGQMLAAWTESAGRTAKEEGSLLGIKADGIVIGGYDPAGTFYGCQSVIQLLEQCEGGPIPGMFIYDWPTLKMRGTLIRHWGFYGKYSKEFAEEVTSEVLARYKLNTVLLESNRGMIYTSHPDLTHSDNAITVEETGRMVDMMRKYHINIVAGGVGTTHVDQWCTDTHPQLAVPGHSSDLDIDNPEAQQFLKDLMDEQIAAFNPSIFHIGGDEGSISAEYTMRCIKWMYDYLAPKGIRCAIWGDMVKNLVKSGVEPDLPKDIIIQDWSYNSSKTDYPDLQLWTQRGMPSWVCPYGVYEENGCPGPWNIYYSAISARDYGSGGLVAFNKAQLGDKNATILTNYTAVPNDYALNNYAMYPFYAEWAWTPGVPTNAPLPFSGREMFLRQFSPDRPVNPTALKNGSDVTLRWTAPINPNCCGIRVVCNYSHYPVDIEDGVTVCDVRAFASESGSFVHRNIPRGAKVYYAFFAYDRLKHFSPPAYASIVDNGPEITLPQAKSMSDNTTVYLTGNIVTAVFSGVFYMESSDRSAASAVVSDYPVKIGEAVSVAGSFRLINGERKLVADWVSIP